MYAWQKLRELNTFKDPYTQGAENNQAIRHQILSTRVYIILLSLSLLFITLFTALRPVTIFTTVAEPSLDAYLQLEAIHSSTLSCLCYQSAVTYSSFFSIEPVYHQVR